MSLSLMTRCDEVWVFGSAITGDMRAEIDLAQWLGIPVVFVPDEITATLTNVP